MPQALRERCHVPQPGREPLAGGEFVLLWLHHAIRAGENPALAVAAEFARLLDRPLLIYQGLAGRHPYNNDRQFTFILEGARDLAVALAAQGQRLCLHLPRDPAAPSPLPGLITRATLVVTEDYPAPPFPRWVRRLSAAAPVPWLQVDAACVLPLRRPGRAYARAFQFRQAWGAEQRRRLDPPWPQRALDTAPYNGPLGFAPLEPGQVDLAECIAACRIDHDVPPVPASPGGFQAGMARWQAFRAAGLPRYADLRNDAAVDWPLGVSRLSPYLHHGQIAAQRIAREAAAMGGAGAEKFLDELLVWRELAFNFCLHSADPGSLSALPEWAQASLAAQRGEPREVVHDDETLARSGSGDRLWDLAQGTLRRHGELHNNLRMTWAKALLAWRPGPEASLASLLDLNHRYALDGCDPNSYAGLLWALGLFDRPHPPASGPGGLVRRRPTADHARRLDLAHYARRVARPAIGRVLRVAVIGAGIAGLSAARVLQDQGHEVQVFEKSRGLGGRAATRYAGDWRFDHGAQYFTARSPAMRRAVAAWRERGLVRTWRPRLARLDLHGLHPLVEDRERLVACPGMNALGGHLAEGLAVQRQTRVAAATDPGPPWRLQDTQGQALGEFDALVVALPAEQAAAWLGSLSPGLAAQAAAVPHQPCWTAMLAWPALPDVGVDALIGADGVLAWAACNGSKPGRSGTTWVVQADADWSRARLGTAPGAVAEALAERLNLALGLDAGPPLHAAAHSWLYAQAATPLQLGALYDPERGLALAGDWLAGGRIEGAFLSGQAAAVRLLTGMAG